MYAIHTSNQVKHSTYHILWALVDFVHQLFGAFQQEY
jgi:hypothetical protein